MNRERYIYKVTLVGSLVNFALTLFKLCAGVLGHSSAMLADAAHSLSDFASDMIIFLCVRISGRPEDADHAYGHGKYETLAAICVGAILLATGLGFLWHGLWTIIDFCRGEPLAPPGSIALWAAGLSIICKEGLYHYTFQAGKRANSSLLKTNAWHHRSDAFSSIATLLGIGGAMFLGPAWAALDPLAACCISVLIIGMAVSFIKPGLDELLEKALPSAEQARIGQIIRQTPGVVDFHRLRTRRIGAGCAVEAHLKIDGDKTLHEAHAIATMVENGLKSELGPRTHIGLHMEPAGKQGPIPDTAECDRETPGSGKN